MTVSNDTTLQEEGLCWSWVELVPLFSGLWLGKGSWWKEKTAHLSADREAEREREGCRGEKKGMVRGGVGRDKGQDTSSRCSSSELPHPTSLAPSGGSITLRGSNNESVDEGRVLMIWSLLSSTTNRRLTLQHPSFGVGCHV